jgi:hypothetical protein
MKVTYSENNSGGYSRMKEEQWTALEKAGWRVNVSQRLAHIEAESMDIAIAKWEFATKKYADDLGCTCCGRPHNFYEDSTMFTED